MKKHLILMALLLGLAVGGLGAAHAVLMDSGEQITYTPTAPVGDLSAADGLVIEQELLLDRHVLWTTQWRPNRSTETQMSFHLESIWEQRGALYRGLNFHLDPPYGVSSDTNIELDPENGGMRPLWLELYRQTADKTKPGEVHTEPYRLRSYISDFPMWIDASLPGIWEGEETNNNIHWPLTDSGDYPEWQLSRPEKTLLDLAQQFRFPVPDDLTMTITATRNEAGELIELESDFSPSPSISSLSTEAGDWIYFIPIAHIGAMERDGTMTHPMDYSLTPNGFGIYRIPSDPEKFSVDGLEFVCPLDDYTVPSLFLPSQAGKELLLVWEEGLQEVLTVLDADTGEELQRLPLWDHTQLLQQEPLLELMLSPDCPDQIRQMALDGQLTPEQYLADDRIYPPWISLRVEDGYLVSMRSIFRQYHEIQVLVPDEAGRYVSQFSQVIPAELGDTYRNVDEYTAWDGKRLALAPVADYSDEPPCGFWLIVVDKNGLLLQSKIQNSLDDTYSVSDYPYPLNCRPRCEIRLRWENNR